MDIRDFIENSPDHYMVDIRRPSGAIDSFTVKELKAYVQNVIAKTYPSSPAEWSADGPKGLPNHLRHPMISDLMGRVPVNVREDVAIGGWSFLRLMDAQVFCTSCQHTSAADANFCGGCGKPVMPHQIAPTANEWNHPVQSLGGRTQ